MNEYAGPNSSHGGPSPKPPSRWNRAIQVTTITALVGGVALAVVTFPGSSSANSSTPKGSASATSRTRTTPSGTSSKTPTSTTGTAAKAAAGKAQPLKGAVIVIDPGHNGNNYAHPEIINKKVKVLTMTKACDTTGTQTNAGYAEHSFTWDLAVKLRSTLRARGATVVLTRSNNKGVGPCITQRAAIGNKAHADLAISLHADGTTSSARGFHVIAPGSVGPNAAIVAPSKRLATAVRNAFQQGTGIPRSTYTGSGTAITVRKDLGGLNLSTVPKIFIECGNMRNAKDATALKSAAWRQRAASALANGMATYLAAEK